MPASAAGSTIRTADPPPWTGSVTTVTADGVSAVHESVPASRPGLGSRRTEAVAATGTVRTGVPSARPVATAPRAATVRRDSDAERVMDGLSAERRIDKPHLPREVSMEG